MIGRVKAVARFALRPQSRHNTLHEARRRWRGAPEWPAHAVSRVLVICHGNICRSPFSERLLALQRPDWHVRSAGLHAGVDAPAEPGALRVAREWDIDLADHGSTPLDAAAVEWADLVIGMEGHHRVQLLRRFPGSRAKAVVLGDFLTSGPFTIEDPWGHDDAFFRSVFERIALASERMVAHARASEAAGRIRV